jgi:hypothetical protein
MPETTSKSTVVRLFERFTQTRIALWLWLVAALVSLVGLVGALDGLIAPKRRLQFWPDVYDKSIDLIETDWWGLCRWNYAIAWRKDENGTRLHARTKDHDWASISGSGDAADCILYAADVFHQRGWASDIKAIGIIAAFGIAMAGTAYPFVVEYRRRKRHQLERSEP